MGKKLKYNIQITYLLIANSFNTFFVKKIGNLKANIDPNLITDPLKNLQNKMKANTSKFELKTVSISSLKKTITQLKSKNSSGCDGFSQKQLKAGVSNLAGPLLNIINASIKNGQFPAGWKEGIVTPVYTRPPLSVKGVEIGKLVRSPVQASSLAKIANFGTFVFSILALSFWHSDPNPYSLHIWQF